MFGFNRNRAKYEYCELIDSDLDKLYQKAEHLKSIGYENAGSGAFFNSDNNQYRITMRKINSLPRKFGDYGKKKEKNDDYKIILFFITIMELLAILFIATDSDKKLKEKEEQVMHYKHLYNEAKNNNSKKDK
ncbi:hypothetical protein [Helicobacter bilis]|uniref:hypothetical protein n=1 Tax=Helicobacter bilis TaxID=37372 RepID=UPI002943F0F8|nr:hypothetical protein [Helicobacter bilis]